MLRKKATSIGYALKGIRIGFTEEHNFQSQVFIAISAMILGALFRISEDEWLAVFCVSGLVLSAELLNTALEELCDMLRDSHDPHIEKIKDLAAGAVLVASSIALIVGAMIFLPRFFSL